MPGDPKECLNHANRCIELAKACNTDTDMRRLLQIATTWVKLAEDLHAAKALIAENEEQLLNRGRD